MRYVAISVTADRAVVECRPSWLGRLLCRQTRVAELEFLSGIKVWVFLVTRREVRESTSEGREILRALEFRLKQDLPSARVIP